MGVGTLLKKKIVEKETAGRESYYKIADVRFRHWLDLKARRCDRIINYVNFVEQHYSLKTERSWLQGFKEFDPDNIETESDRELDRFLGYWFVAQEVFVKK